MIKKQPDSANGLFHSAQPVWPVGRESEKNLLVGFRAVFDARERSPWCLRVAASTIYRAYLNGTFLCHGPARGPHGYFRVDEWPLAELLTVGTNWIAIEVAGYNINSYALISQPSFLQAEVVADGKTFASTAGEGTNFEAATLPDRTQRVPRYSWQRPFSEAYRLRPGYDLWRIERSAAFVPVRCGVVGAKRLLPRRVPYPTFPVRAPRWHVASGAVRDGAEGESLWKPSFLTDIGPDLEGFTEADLEAIPLFDLQRVATTSRRELDGPVDTPSVFSLDANSFHLLDFGADLTGFLGARIRCAAPAKLCFAFDEILTDGDVDFKRLNCANVVRCDLLEAGVYEFETVEPYVLRYLKLIALDAACLVDHVSLREYANPQVFDAHFACSDRRLNRVFEAGRETFRQNAVDIFMDCPSRERAGWLCDSYFASRVAPDLMGNAVIERNFFENFLLAPPFASLPDGMLPMCYPADHPRGSFIPNWALWFVLQMEEYFIRSGDRAMVDGLRPKIVRLFEYFRQFHNSDGLLEKLPGWIFVEWSKANDFVQDVNYPTNMLYASALEAADRLYRLPSLAADAERIKNAIRQQSFDGRFFLDNALREDRGLRVTTNRTEVCQYFAFYFGVASPQTHGRLWDTLRDEFGMERNPSRSYPDVHRANAFVGNYLRMELLSRYDCHARLLEEARDHFHKMAEITGTLWENDDVRASCNHGFASHVVHVWYRDILGIHRIDAQERKVVLRFTDLPLEWCEGRMPVGRDAVHLSWWRDGGKLHYRVRAPAAFSIAVDHRCAEEIIPHP
ncbi:MAG: hypothetical protein HY360_12230 [Verrucomicrobia bacterium]|nr:hypothetical protein [Verrucomicrobiota bacterium]